MSAQPIHHHDPLDPEAILACLPDRARSVFLREYREAAERAARDVTAFGALRQLLQEWAMHALAATDPAYRQGRVEAVASSAAHVSLAELAARRAG